MIVMLAMATSILISPTQAERLRPDSVGAVAIVEGFHAALRAGDSLAAMRRLAPDALVLEGGGIETRDEYRSHHLHDDIQFAQAVSSTSRVARATVLGDAAWVVSMSTTTGTFEGRPINSNGAELIVLRRQNGEWKISAIHWSSRARRTTN